MAQLGTEMSISGRLWVCCEHNDADLSAISCQQPAACYPCEADLLLAHAKGGQVFKSKLHLTLSVQGCQNLQQHLQDS